MSCTAGHACIYVVVIRMRKKTTYERREVKSCEIIIARRAE